MKPKILSLITVMGVALAGHTAKAEASYNMGWQSREIADAERERHWPVEIWYPTEATPAEISPAEPLTPIFKPWQALPGAPPATGEFPLLIFSHGTGGNRFASMWIIEHLVTEGYVVLSLDHYGNNSSHKIPREFLKWWERAIDIQYILSEFLADEAWGAKVDPNRIGVFGHSLGGYTSIALAGGQVDRLSPHMPKGKPPEFPETNEEIDYVNDPELVASFHRWAQRVKDDRIKAAFVMAPAIGFGFHDPRQTAEIDIPIFIVAGNGDRQTPVETDAGNYHRLIPTSEIHLFEAPVGHYIFLNEGTAMGKQAVPMILQDAPGVDRGLIHAKTAKMAAAFFGKHLR